MKSIVVGGHSRNVGKTSVAAGLIRAFREYPWTAFKISSHKHANIPMPADESGHCSYNIYEEKDSGGASDSSRFLIAGARRSFWVQIDENNADEGMRQLLPILDSYPYVMIESNRILSVMRPDLHLMVVRFDVKEFKDSARSFLKSADAIVAVNSSFSNVPWVGVNDILSAIPQFVTSDPWTLPSELISFVGSRLLQDGNP